MYNKLVTVLEHGPFIFHATDGNGKIVHVSDEWLKLFGYNREEIIGKDSTDFLDKKSRQYMEETILPRFYETGICEPFDCVYVKKDGTPVNIRFSAISVDNIEIEEKYRIAILTDITENISNLRELDRYRHNLEELIRIRTEELHIAMDMYKTLARTSPVCIMRTNADGECEYVNKKWKQMTGQTRKEALGRGWLDAIYEEDRNKVTNIIQSATTKNSEWTEEFRVIGKNENVSWVVCSGNIINGGGAGHVITFTNITSKKEILPELLKLQKTMKYETIKRRVLNGS